jgi:hypothetical protein
MVRVEVSSSANSVRKLVRAWADLTAFMRNLIAIQIRAITAFEKRALQQAFDVIAESAWLSKNTCVVYGMQESADSRVRVAVLRRVWDVWMGVCVRMSYALRVLFMAMQRRQARVKSRVLVAWAFVTRSVRMHGGFLLLHACHSLLKTTMP